METYKAPFVENGCRKATAHNDETEVCSSKGIALSRYDGSLVSLEEIFPGEDLADIIDDGMSGFEGLTMIEVAPDVLAVAGLVSEDVHDMIDVLGKAA